MLFSEPAVRLRFAGGYRLDHPLPGVVVAGMLDAKVPCVYEPPSGVFVTAWRNEEFLRQMMRTVAGAARGIDREVAAEAGCN